MYDVNSSKSFETLDSWRDEFLIQVRPSLLPPSCRDNAYSFISISVVGFTQRSRKLPFRRHRKQDRCRGFETYGQSETRHDLVSVKGKHSILRDFGKGSYERRTRVPSCLRKRSATRGRGRSVRFLRCLRITSRLSHTELSCMGLCSLSDYPDPIRINAQDTDSSYGCSC